MPDTRLTKELRQELWLALTARLQSGEAMWNTRDFVVAMASSYEDLTGHEADDALHAELRRMVEVVNRDHPDTYLAQGVQNGITRVFEDAVKNLNWDVATLQSRGARALRRFSKQDAVREAFEDANLSPTDVNVLSCVQNAIAELGGAPKLERPQAPPVQLRPDLAVERSAPAPAAAAGAADTVVDADTQEAIASGEVDAKEAKRHLERAEKRRSELESTELEKVPKRLNSYMLQGVVSEEEAEKLKQLSEVDERVKRGEITEVEAAEHRNSILSGEARDQLERRVREVVSDTVKYLQVFEGMQKINPDYHDAIAFLIEHKYEVCAADGADVDMAPAVHGLMEDVEILERCIDIMERKDQEIRMLSVRLHPYSAIMKRGVERIGNMTIEPTFVDELENISTEEMGERLHSDDQKERVRPAADMRCFISLIDHITKKTRFRKELRLLRISKQIEEYYNATSDMNEARSQAENFLNRRLRRLFPDMDTDEAAELKQRSTQMMDQIEERVRDERQGAIEEKRKKSEAAAPKAEGGGDEPDMELSEDEIAKGVQIGRVEMRVAGSTRRIPQKIMPDPEDPQRFVLVTRDRETQELGPAMRRGQKRYVERNREGSWQEEK